METQAYTPNEVTRMLKISKGTLFMLIREGKIKATVIGNPKSKRKNYRISTQAIKEFLGDKDTIDNLVIGENVSGE